jgi:hypothetical protein
MGKKATGTKAAGRKAKKVAENGRGKLGASHS